MDTLYNTTIIETNGVRSIAGGGTGASTVTGALQSLLSSSNINVGIGTATPNQKLTVVGSISASGTITGNTFAFGVTGAPGALGTFIRRVSAYDFNGAYIGYIPIYI